MKIDQISVFLENRKGRLREVTELLGTNRINIKALTIAETDDFGVLRMVVDRPENALSVLKKSGFIANQTEIVAVEVDDRPGGLASILKAIEHAELNVEYMYGFIEKQSDKALMVFRFDDADRAVKVLTESNINIVGQKDIQGL